jgi:hypothetical protein
MFRIEAPFAADDGATPGLTATSGVASFLKPRCRSNQVSMSARTESNGIPASIAQRHTSRQPGNCSSSETEAAGSETTQIWAVYGLTEDRRTEMNLEIDLRPCSDFTSSLLEISRHCQRT